MKGCGVRANPSRFYFITREEAQKVLDACPDAQWRLLFALSRFGGLRCPSEHLGLRWGDVDWERNRITVHSPKTEHHEGGESRQIPDLPRVAAVPGRGLGASRAGDGVRHHPLPGQQRQPADPIGADHPAGRPEAVAEAVPEPAVHPGNGAGRDATPFTSSAPGSATPSPWRPSTTCKCAMRTLTGPFGEAAQNPAHLAAKRWRRTRRSHKPPPSRHELPEMRKAQPAMSLGPVVAESGEFWQTGQVPPVGLEPTTL